VRRFVFYGALSADAAAALSWLYYPRLINLTMFESLGPSVTFAGRCSRLQSLHVGSRPTMAPPHDAPELLLTNAATLTHVVLHVAITPPTLARLAGLQRLDYLRLYSDAKVLRVEGTPALVAQSARRPICFATLRRLCVYAPLAEVKALLPLVRQSHLVRLRIWFADGRSVDVSELCAMSGLTELRIEWTHDSALCSEQLLTLSRLRQLRTLCMRMPCVGVERCGMDDKVFAKLVSGLGELRELYVRLRPVLTLAPLQSLGTHCPLLKDLDMVGTFALRELPMGDDGVLRSLFPNLRNLRLNRFEEDDEFLDDDDRMNAQVSGVLDALNYYAPQLVNLSLAMVNGHGMDAVDKEVMKRWHERAESAKAE
jgi:hypothetical protein